MIITIKYPYTLKTGSLKKFVQDIPSTGLPQKVTIQYLESLGLKSKNDRSIIPVLKFLKFLDDAGNPTERYKHYRDRSKSKKVLGTAIQEAYASLFRQYSDADKKDNQTLQNYFSTQTGLGKKAVSLTVDTFKALCSIADVQEGEGLAEESFPSELLASENNTSFHNLSLSLSNGKKAKIILPHDATPEDIERLKKLLDVLK